MYRFGFDGLARFVTQNHSLKGGAHWRTTHVVLVYFGRVCWAVLQNDLVYFRNMLGCFGFEIQNVNAYFLFFITLTTRPSFALPRCLHRWRALNFRRCLHRWGYALHNSRALLKTASEIWPHFLKPNWHVFGFGLNRPRAFSWLVVR